MSEGESGSDWPVELAGVTESVVTTLGPNDRWNAAALGLHAPDGDGDPVTARTWGNTRTRRNFRRQGGAYVQFVDDPVTFVDSALSIHEVDAPVLESAAAWAEVEVERVDAGEDGGTRWEEWTLTPVESTVEREAVPTINRGFNAAIEATVAASRLGVDAYDTETMERRLAYFESVGRKCGDDRVQEAFARLRDHIERDSQ
ncbi:MULTISPECIES: DUF447 domain-containing protein [Halorussus]|uniref:DUF447 domain-containing protein n=1 Tax=Halorussus TaxID=1070314 RepID=UPI00209ED14F|nr:DUF447 domain-containing protein [Halorussus vallis]USZ76732.1 DUF447 family protein [Halorussus vallis]